MCCGQRRNRIKRTIRLLVGKGANLDHTDAKGQTPLFLAARNGPWGAVKCLLDFGASSRARDASGRPPLFQLFGTKAKWDEPSYLSDMIDIVKLLLDGGAEPELVDTDNKHTAAFHIYTLMLAEPLLSDWQHEIEKHYGSVAEFRSNSGTREALAFIMDLFVRKLEDSRQGAD